MTDVKIPFGDNLKDNAILLLAAAESLGRDQSEVRSGTGYFLVDEEIANEAGLGEEKPAKKAAAKKTAKKSASKKSTK